MRPQGNRRLGGEHGRPGTVVRWRHHLAREVRRPRAWLLAAIIVVVVLSTVKAGTMLSASDRKAAESQPEAASQLSASPSPSLSASPSHSAATSPSAGSSPQKTSRPAGTRAGGRWPNEKNTGVPAGTRLSTYAGPCQITRANTVIDAKTVNCDLDVRAANVTIKRSKINGAVILDTDRAGSSQWSYTLADSEVDAGVRQYPAVSYGNMTVLRSNIYGGETSVQCGEKAISCTVDDSWLHGQNIPEDANWHLGGFLSNGGHNIRIRHNTIVCDAAPTQNDGGCTGDLNLFGDFAVVSDVVIDDNYLGANTGSSYCLYAGDTASKPFPRADHIVIRNNVFERGTNGKCGAYGPVAGFNRHGTGNVWTNNRWEGGGAVAPEN